MSKYQPTALSSGATKEASLYFDHVVPLFAVGEGMIGGGSAAPWPRALTEQLLPPYLQNDEFMQPFVDLQHSGLKINYAMAHEGKDPDNDPDFRKECESLALAWAELLSKYGLLDAPLVAQESVSTRGADDLTPDIGITLRNLKLVDVADVSLEQLAELRRDSHTRSALRRLRLFACENYVDKSRAFVEDDLLPLRTQLRGASTAGSSRTNALCGRDELYFDRVNDQLTTRRVSVATFGLALQPWNFISRSSKRASRTGP